MDGRPNRRIKAAFSNSSGLLWMGLKTSGTVVTRQERHILFFLIGSLARVIISEHSKGVTQLVTKYRSVRKLFFSQEEVLLICSFN